MQSQVSNPVVRGEEQVESLGGKFLTVDGAENLETKGGYAKEVSEEFKKKQEDLLALTLKKIDVVICDNCSQDNTVLLVKKFAEKSKFKYRDIENRNRKIEIRHLKIRKLKNRKSKI